MSHRIESITIGDVLDKRLVLRNGAIARKLAIGNNWVTLRIGFRVAFQDLGMNILGTPRFMFGVMSNPSPDLDNGPQSGNVSHFLGIRSRSSTWTRETGPARYNESTTGRGIVKMVGATVTEGTLNMGTVALRSSASPDTIRGVYMLDITKGDPFQFRLYQNHSSVVDVSVEQLMQAMEIRDMTGTEYSAIIPGTHSTPTGSISGVDEGTDGPLNAIVVSWDRSFPEVYLSEIFFTHFDT